MIKFDYIQKFFIIVLFTLFCYQQGIASATDTLYVSPNGSDASGNGTKSNPYKTILHTLDNLKEGQHNTIYLDSGEFVIKGQVELPVEVDLIGSGIGKTILKADSSFYFPDPDGGYRNTLIYLLKGVGKQEIAHFTIDGEGKQLFSGLGVRVREKVYVHDLYIKETFHSGISSSAPNNSVFHSIKLENCSWGHTGYQHGALYLGSNIKNTDFHDFEIIEGIDYPSDAWGYAVKHMGMGGTELRNVRFFNSSFEVPPIGLWHDGQAPNIALEYWGTNLADCEIFNCRTNANFSLVGSETTPEDYENFPIRVHRNTFYDCKSHAVEAAMDNIEVDQNYFTDSKFTVVCYTPDSNHKNWNIHHNIYIDNDMVITNASFVRSKGALSDLTFANNTCFIVKSSNVPVFRVESKKSTNINIINNIIYKDYNNTNDRIFKTLNNAEIEDFSVKNNLLYNYDIPEGEHFESDNNITGEMPGLQLSGDKPLPYFQVTDQSNLIDAGIIMDYPYSGEKNDIGAHELTIGIGDIPIISLDATIDTSRSVINLQVEATDNTHGISKIEVYADQYLLDEADANTLSGTYELNTDTIYFIKAFAYNSGGYMQAAYSTVNNTEMITRINDLPKDKILTLYPNPANKNVIIKAKNNASIDNISIHSLTGENILYKSFSKRNNKVEIKTGHLKTGIYLVVIGLMNRERIVKKIVIEK